MTPELITYFRRVRGLLIEREKALTMERAAVIGERRAVERLLGMKEQDAPPVAENVTLTNVSAYTEL